MPYVKAKEYKKLQKQVEELQILKQLGKDNTWRCGVCLKRYNSLYYLDLFRGDAYICNEDKTPYFQRVAMMTIKGLRQNLLRDNIERLILQYVFNDGYNETRLCLTADDEEVDNLEDYCRDKYYNGSFKPDWAT